MIELGPPLPERGRFRALYGQINRIKEAIRALAPVPSPNLRTSFTSIGVVREAFPGGPGEPGEAEVKQYIVKSVGDDTLTAREFDGTNETSGDVLIAKPFNLRRTGWHGQTIVYALEPYPGAPASMSITYAYVTPTYRTATKQIGGASGTEHQVILPRYVPNFSRIYALTSTNGTGVPGVDLIEVNSARAFGRVIAS